MLQIMKSAFLGLFLCSGALLAAPQSKVLNDKGKIVEVATFDEEVNRMIEGMVLDQIIDEVIHRGDRQEALELSWQSTEEKSQLPDPTRKTLR